LKIVKPNSESFSGLYELIKSFSDRKLMLPLTMDEILHRAQAFRVICAEDSLSTHLNQVIGSAHLDIFTPVLAEIKSLAVADAYQGKGYGSALVRNCEHEALELGIKKVFVLTYQEEFFKKLGYSVVSRDTLPEKVYKECVKCVFYNDCNEIAMTKDLEENLRSRN
jgi:amino-acid N-acetyltransferase